MRALLAGLLSLLLVVPAGAAARDPRGVKKQAISLAIGSPLEVRLLTGEKLICRYVALTDAHITVASARAGAIVEQEIPFARIEKMLPADDRKPHHRLLAGCGKLFTAAAVIGLIAAAAMGGRS
jgi:hypothetical protein